jgi:hypothetical protein
MPSEIEAWVKANQTKINDAMALGLIKNDDNVVNTAVAGHSAQPQTSFVAPGRTGNGGMYLPKPGQQKPKPAKIYSAPDVSQFENDADFSAKDLAQLKAHMSRNGNDPNKALASLYDIVHGPDWKGVLEDERRKDRKVAAWLQGLIKSGAPAATKDDLGTGTGTGTGTGGVTPGVITRLRNKNSPVEQASIDYSNVWDKVNTKKALKQDLDGNYIPGEYITKNVSGDMKYSKDRQYGVGPDGIVKQVVQNKDGTYTYKKLKGAERDAAVKRINKDNGIKSSKKLKPSSSTYKGPSADEKKALKKAAVEEKEAESWIERSKRFDKARRANNAEGKDENENENEKQKQKQK